MLLEKDIDDLGAFLKEKAIDSLINESLLVAEGGPTDSESLQQLFHFHGVNMRYLGDVLLRFRNECDSRQAKFKHIDFLLEKEALIRSMKHVIIRHLNSSSLEKS